MRKYVLIATAAASLFASAAFAGTSAKSDDKVPAKMRTSITKQCDETLRERLIAPLEAKIINIGAGNLKGESYFVYVCYQARNRGGGYGRAGGRCEFDTKGKMTETHMVDSPTGAEVSCMMAKEYANK